MAIDNLGHHYKLIVELKPKDSQASEDVVSPVIPELYEGLVVEIWPFGSYDLEFFGLRQSDGRRTSVPPKDG